MSVSSAAKFVGRIVLSAVFVWIPFALHSTFPPERPDASFSDKVLRYLAPSITVQAYADACCESLEDGRLENDWEAVKNSNPYSVIRYARSIAKKDDRFLVFKYPDFLYYGQLRLTRELDPVLDGYYQASDVRSAFEELRRLGITHVYMPSYEVLSLTLSKTYDIVSNPNLATLLSEGTTGVRLFKLAAAYGESGIEPIPIFRWEAGGQIPPLTGWSKVVATRTVHTGPEANVMINKLREDSTSCFGTLNCSGSYREVAPFEARPLFQEGKRYRVSATLSGLGKVRTSAFVTQPSPQRIPKHQVPLWTAVASDTPRRISQVFFSPTDSRGIAIFFTLVGKGAVTIKDVTIDRLDPDQ